MRSGINYYDRWLECKAENVEWSTGTWLVITPEPAMDRVYLHGLHIFQKPLKKFILDKMPKDRDDNSNQLESLCSHLTQLARYWYDMTDAHCPLSIHRYFSLNGYLLSEKEADQIESQDDLTRRILQVILSYVEQARDHSNGDREEGKTHHLRWIEDGGNCSDPVTAQRLTVDLKHPNQAQALIRLIRTPQPYDGSEDFIFEKYLKVGILLLFDPQDIYVIPSDLSHPDDPIQPKNLPFVIIANDREFTPELRERMGSAAKSTLDRLRKKDMSQDTSPHRNIVYGLHWYKDHIQIIAHFICHYDGGPAKYCQTIVARHWITLNPEQLVTPFRWQSEDDTVLYRWRIYCSLSMINYEVQQLKKQLGMAKVLEGDQPPYTRNVGVVYHFDETQHPYLVKLRQHWRESDGFILPEDWILEGDINTEGVRRDPRGKVALDRSRCMMMSLTKLALKPIRHMLKPLKFEEIKANSSNFEYLGPDFLHPLSIPRSKFHWPTMVSDPRKTTEPHAAKLYDFLTMSTTTYADINIFVANAFANHSGYSVQWCPPQFQSPSTPDIFIDFAVVVTARDSAVTDIGAHRDQNIRTTRVPVFLGGTM
ncbi:hypothetical protein QCA50_004015 [Cerrena zonata]|uniref:Uncharacterized protein n=1 Tax=Cerrena zonata TaxID=2478898 RepID=A0AAW0GMT8_9APHY